VHSLTLSKHPFIFLSLLCLTTGHSISLDQYVLF
jgi:hypothetical protein